MLDRNTIINKLEESLKPLPFIYALWLEGADATDTVDEYSDIDFWWTLMMNMRKRRIML